MVLRLSAWLAFAAAQSATEVAPAENATDITDDNSTAPDDTETTVAPPSSGGAATWNAQWHTYRVVNDGWLSSWWGVAEVTFYSDRECTDRARIIVRREDGALVPDSECPECPKVLKNSGYLHRGQYGTYNSEITSMAGQPMPAQDYGPQFAFDGDDDTYWYSRCVGCRSYVAAVVEREIGCVEILQSGHFRDGARQIWVQEALETPAVFNGSQLDEHLGERLKWNETDSSCPNVPRGRRFKFIYRGALSDCEEQVDMPIHKVLILALVVLAVVAVIAGHELNFFRSERKKKTNERKKDVDTGKAATGRAVPSKKVS
mmetsp:Transcript_66915/g.178471  ORF Transcript_66915/g.178471 Transcript_66915/m.178471 type:complete len:317 (+) Transcript_66915:46-996(+)